MSEIRERAKSAQKEMSVTGWDRWANVVTDLLAELERTSKWKDAIIDACVVSWVLKKEHENNPKLAVNDLCVWCHSVALDPKVSSEAKALHGRIAMLEAENERVNEVADKYKLALELALVLLEKYEPGDSRAVSDEFVAMAAILCDVSTSDDCVGLIRNAMDKARKEQEQVAE